MIVLSSIPSYDMKGIKIYTFDMLFIIVINITFLFLYYMEF
ncbi:Uncharacterised protein [Providencia rustigianii]|uniref:Uncharacterized protein n=1 Tax=Providencia rustigianii TaxID=158850 RepID=A0A379G685_9GAMM|nr:Uncharacterised protein [Providencia rustigianii]